MDKIKLPFMKCVCYQRRNQRYGWNAQTEWPGEQICWNKINTAPIVDLGNRRIYVQDFTNSNAMRPTKSQSKMFQNCRRHVSYNHWPKSLSRRYELIERVRGESANNRNNRKLVEILSEQQNNNFSFSASDMQWDESNIKQAYIRQISHS